MQIFRALPMWIKAALTAALLVAILAGFKACTMATDHKTNTIARTAEEKGGANVRAAAAEEGLKDVIKAQEARAVVDRDADAHYDVCVRTSRTPQNCRRESVP